MMVMLMRAEAVPDAGNSSVMPFGSRLFIRMLMDDGHGWEDMGELGGGQIVSSPHDDPQAGLYNILLDAKYPQQPAHGYQDAAPLLFDETPFSYTTTDGTTIRARYCFVVPATIGAS